MSFKEVIAVYYENHTEPETDSLGKIWSYWMLKQVIHIGTTVFKGLMWPDLERY
jgi:hypothetical protein